VRELKAAGAEEIFLEHEHGDSKVKEQQAIMFERACEGDTIITLEVSRLARSTQQLCELINIVRDKHLRLCIVGSITLDCRDGQPDPMSEAFLQMAGVFSQLELSMIRARVRSGMENAKAKGAQIGRPKTSLDDVPAAFLKHYPAFKAGQFNLSELARLCDLSRTTVYKYIGLVECRE
jgi:DNA invertase Pin-like site-specific DNA recombinase